MTYHLTSCSTAQPIPLTTISISTLPPPSTDVSNIPQAAFIPSLRQSVPQCGLVQPQTHPQQKPSTSGRRYRPQWKGYIIIAMVSRPLSYQSSFLPYPAIRDTCLTASSRSCSDLFTVITQQRERISVSGDWLGGLTGTEAVVTININSYYCASIQIH